jgi:hypothetical protein
MAARRTKGEVRAELQAKAAMLTVKLATRDVDTSEG